MGSYLVFKENKVMFLNLWYTFKFFFAGKSTTKNFVCFSIYKQFESKFGKDLIQRIIDTE